MSAMSEEEMVAMLTELEQQLQGAHEALIAAIPPTQAAVDEIRRLVDDGEKQMTLVREFGEARPKDRELY